MVFSSVSRAAKAASVGAKTVKGPVPLRVPTRLAVVRASTSRVNSAGLPWLSATAVSTTVLLAGRITLSTTWITPLLAATSVAVMVATRLRPSVSLSAPLTLSTLKMPPASGVIFLPSGTSALTTLAPSTWYFSTAVSKAVSASSWALVTPSSVSRAEKAALVGANTVNGPVPDSVPARPAAVTASTRMLNCASAFATSTMVPGPLSLLSSQQPASRAELARPSSMLRRCIKVVIRISFLGGSKLLLRRPQSY